MFGWGARFVATLFKENEVRKKNTQKGGGKTPKGTQAGKEVEAQREIGKQWGSLSPEERRSLINWLLGK